jgi:hypothetical protein
VFRVPLDTFHKQLLHCRGYQADRELPVELRLHVRAFLLQLQQLLNAGGYGGVLTVRSTYKCIRFLSEPQSGP